MYKVGDKVVLLDGECLPDPHQCGWEDCMRKWEGQTATITHISTPHKHIQTDSTSLYWWSPHWVKPANEQESLSTHYDEVELGVLKIGSTLVRRATRRTNGKVGYVIKQEGTAQNNTVVLQEDLLKLAAVLADLDSGALKI